MSRRLSADIGINALSTSPQNFLSPQCALKSHLQSTGRTIARRIGLRALDVSLDATETKMRAKLKT
jgi:hypothetical protein